MEKFCKGASFAEEMEVQFDSQGGDHMETAENKVKDWIEAVEETTNEWCEPVSDADYNAL